MLTNHVENINRTNKGRDLILDNKPQVVPEEQKGYRERSRGTAELLYIDQHVLNEGKTRRKNVAMAWIDYKKKIYDMVLQTWIINFLKMHKILHEFKLYQENHWK